MKINKHKNNPHLFETNIGLFNKFEKNIRRTLQVVADNERHASFLISNLIKKLKTCESHEHYNKIINKHKA